MKYLIEDATLTNVANSIRTKEGSTGTIKVGDFASKIANLPTGENLDTELNAQDTLLENQNTAIADIYDALENKGENPYNAVVNNIVNTNGYTLKDIVEELPIINLGSNCWNINMFADCTNLKSVKVNGNLTDPSVRTNYMFQNCRNIKKIDLSELYADSLTSSLYMFQSCDSIEEIDISTLDLTKITNYTRMFQNCGTAYYTQTGQTPKIYVKDEASQSWVLNLVGNDRPSYWSTDNVIIKGGN